MKLALLMALVFLTSCSGEDSEDKPKVSAVQQTVIPSSVVDYQLLFMGNSHSRANQLPDLVATLIKDGTVDKTVTAQLAPGSKFLDERIDDGATLELLTSQHWSHVILQAQKYSSSGMYFYPTDAAEEWIRRIKAQNGLPILFPEWPRRGNREEGQRVHDLHLSIASKEEACVAPIGLAWEASLARFPSLSLHAADGNHSNLAGALLTAYVLYEVITGLPAKDIGYSSTINISEVTQGQLSDVASTVIAQRYSCSL